MLCPLFCRVVYHMMETGWVKVSSTNVLELHYRYQEEKKQPRPDGGSSDDFTLADSG